MTKTQTHSFPEVTTDSVFVSSWGYEQTNVDFYKVVKRTPKMVYLQRVGNQTMTTETSMSGTVIPDFSNEIGEPFRVKIFDYGSGPCVSIYSFATARLWDGKPSFTSSWY